MKRHLPLEPQPKVQRYVECIANNILAVLPDDHKDIDWEVVVFDEDEINAFADPNGKIGVFNGILKVADTPDALAAVIGHEVAHATQDHVMDRARKNARQEIWAMFGGAATGAGDMWRQGLAIMSGLPYAREQETECRPRRSRLHGESRVRPACRRVPLEEHGCGESRERTRDARRNFFRLTRRTRRVSTT